ncbi:hypothetical protein HRI_001658100 [Hibiscus trionum]|uniref:Uncharacterized protein n=1 Tax=Hibiscus trionum TaxID=183268 RepID=A0A9W7HM11_HIBTR|nr:hypothetical protein HRI_001658100 [Hibiscus trionum]
MAISLNSVFGFNFKYVSRSSVGASVLKGNPIVSPLQMYGSVGFMHQKRWGLCLSVADSDPLSTDSSIKDSGDAERLVSDQVSAVNPPSLDDKSRFQNSVVSNGSMVFSNPEQEASSSPNLQSTTRKVSLTAKERLRAARVLNRYAESKPSKSEMGSKVLDAMRESDKGKKRSRLPEAPTNLFDDSKRGLPKPGLTFQFPGGNDLLLIIFSVVFISTVMFTTTYIVWKVGAIHFNEY